MGTTEEDIEKLGEELAALRLHYRQAGHNLATQVAEDLSFVREAREEVERITTILRGTELFGRYAQDADHHARVANRWRAAAVFVLLLSPLFLVLIEKLAAISGVALAVTFAPMFTLFIYASVESHNHRRREFDRRRISLRVSAIEAFTKQRRDAGRAGDRKIAEELMDEFVRKHFIQPDLDSNDMSYLGPRLSLVTVFSRGGRQQSPRAAGSASPKQ
ncbi:hypothetical protein [Lentzea albidocapillata]|uniref:Uncharacterized protein n=1 Tax=Lentzea albidocapillata TaxID=40571 RepID=A0A1W2CKE6_9PSEU|nr:hypothetical protein [Lentzea albidocapillata]SMC85661.1 hypothetical protein SAMN05660733_02143 [Lentzea albidocapillata]